MPMKGHKNTSKKGGGHPKSSTPGWHRRWGSIFVRYSRKKSYYPRQIVRPRGSPNTYQADDRGSLSIVINRPKPGEVVTPAHIETSGERKKRIREFHFERQVRRYMKKDGWAPTIAEH